MPALTDTRHLYQSLGTTYLVVGLVVFGVVMAALLVAVLTGWRRARRGRSSSRIVDRPIAEGLYFVGLIGVVIWLMTMNFGTLNQEDGLRTVAERDRATVHVRVFAAQWNWRFVYPGRPAVQMINQPLKPTLLVVPTGTPVEFAGRSQDVLHDFWIPALRYQRQVWPDHTETWVLVFPRAGRYQGLCAWFCGLYHQNMHFVVQAMRPAAFRAWLARKRREAAA